MAHDINNGRTEIQGNQMVKVKRQSLKGSKKGCIAGRGLPAGFSEDWEETSSKS